MKTNYDRIKAMSVEEMAEFLSGTTRSIALKLNGNYITNDVEYIKQYLESEVQGE